MRSYVRNDRKYFFDAQSCTRANRGSEEPTGPRAGGKLLAKLGSKPRPICCMDEAGTVTAPLCTVSRWPLMSAEGQQQSQSY